MKSDVTIMSVIGWVIVAAICVVLVWLMIKAKDEKDVVKSDYRIGDYYLPSRICVWVRCVMKGGEVYYTTQCDYTSLLGAKVCPKCKGEVYVPMTIARDGRDVVTLTDGTVLESRAEVSRQRREAQINGD